MTAVAYYFAGITWKIILNSNLNLIIDATELLSLHRSIQVTKRSGLLDVSPFTRQ